MTDPIRELAERIAAAVERSWYGDSREPHGMAKHIKPTVARILREAGVTLEGGGQAGKLLQRAGSAEPVTGTDTQPGREPAAPDQPHEFVPTRVRALKPGPVRELDRCCSHVWKGEDIGIGECNRPADDPIHIRDSRTENERIAELEEDLVVAEEAAEQLGQDVNDLEAELEAMTNYADEQRALRKVAERERDDSRLAQVYTQKEYVKLRRLLEVPDGEGLLHYMMGLKQHNESLQLQLAEAEAALYGRPQ